MARRDLLGKAPIIFHMVLKCLFNDMLICIGQCVGRIIKVPVHEIMENKW